MRTSSWENIGHDVRGSHSMEEVLRASGLDYEVRQSALVTQEGFPINDKVALVNDYGVLGIVSSKFGVVQNREAFEFVDYMGDDLEYEKAGQTKSGMVYVIAKLPEVSILGDSFVPHVIFRNAFNGRFSVAAAICPLRIVCQNQFGVAFGESPNTITIKHTVDAAHKLREAKEVLRRSADYMTHLNVLAERLAAKRIGPQEVMKVANKLFPIGEDVGPRAQAIADKKRSELLAAYNADDNANFAGTAWGIVNAYADYITHRVPSGRKDTRDENKFVKLSFDTPIDNVLKLVA